MKKKDIVASWNARVNLPGLLLSLGEDLERRELLETPERMRKAWEEQLSGYQLDPEEIFEKTWPNEGGGLQVCRNIFFSSLCEHHLLAFTGHCDIIYEPHKDGEVIGLSKLARLVDCFARRLQIQERLVNNIADAINEYLKPKGVLVIARAQHLCCTGRGVRRETMLFTTCAIRGRLDKTLLALALEGGRHE